MIRERTPIISRPYPVAPSHPQLQGGRRRAAPAALRCSQNRPRNQFRRQDPRLVIRHAVTQKLGVTPLPFLCVFAWQIHKPSFCEKNGGVHPPN